MVVQQPHEGAYWISKLDGDYLSWKGELISCYYHPTRKHTASTEGKLGLKVSEAGPSQWAVSKQTRAMFGNKTHYNTL